MQAGQYSAKQILLDQTKLTLVHASIKNGIENPLAMIQEYICIHAG